MSVRTKQAQDGASTGGELVERFKAICRMCHGGCGTIVEMVGEVAGVRVEVAYDGALSHPAFVPRAKLVIDDPDRLQRVSKAMLAGDPPIRVGCRPGLLYVDPMTLQPGEEWVVGERLRAALRR